MNENILKFEESWKAFNTPGVGSEVDIDLAIDLARNDPEILALVEEKFKLETNSDYKLYLAIIAIQCGLKEPYFSYLRSEHGWVDADFNYL